MKKIICIALVLLNVLCVCSFASVQMSDEQAADLKAFGIMVGDEDGNMRLSDSITRAEAVKMICVAGGINDVSMIDAFPDVEDKHWAYKYICTAKENNIIAGDENGNFNPESNITNEEIVKMIICLLGYGERANQLGGYPGGYTMQASSLKITENMQLEVNAAATRNDVGVMIANALDAPMMMQDGFGAEITYIVMDGEDGRELITLRKRLDK